MLIPIIPVVMFIVVVPYLVYRRQCTQADAARQVEDYKEMMLIPGEVWVSIRTGRAVVVKEVREYGISLSGVGVRSKSGFLKSFLPEDLYNFHLIKEGRK